jgi:integration host factor subunit alpha
MSITKASLIDSIYNNCGFSKAKSEEIFDTIIEEIKKTLASGEDVMISVGKFCVKNKNQRRGRNPATGEDLTLGARKVVTFKWSGMLKDKING